MSVWNKWLDWFKREDESHETLQEPTEIKTQVKRNNNSEVELEEARMTYQYAKQEFDIGRNKQYENKTEGPPKKTKAKQGAVAQKKEYLKKSLAFLKVILNQVLFLHLYMVFKSEKNKEKTVIMIG
ncbi:hypothetical protein [Bacillus sp. JCM 19041]|uniref:hypothetical protein n=1 Tax=Bacillus sp. JCM 19041 TaxID=1460637 RepID=UPI0006D12038